MNVIMLVARLLLAVIFLWSGLAKLADRSGSRQAMREFGVPRRLATPVAILVPLAEIAASGLLVPATSAWLGALAALALLLTFTAAAGYHLARGHAPRCHCFGQASDEPIGPATLARNFGLIALASMLAGLGRDNAGASVTAWLLATTPVQRAELALTVLAVLLLGYGCLLLVRLQQGQEVLIGAATLGSPVQRPERSVDAEVTVPAAGFGLPDLTGTVVTLDDLLWAGRPVLLVFSDPGCGSCLALRPELESWQREYAGRLTIAVISTGTRETHPEAQPYQVPVLLQRNREVAAAYRVPATPCAVVVLPDRTSVAAPICGAEQIRALATRTVGEPADPTPAAPGADGRLTLPVVPPHEHAPQRTGVPIGEPAPEFTLPDLDGQPVSLADFRGWPTLLVFWNPGCGFCTDMIAELRERAAATHENGGPALVVVSTGDPAANRTLRLQAPVLLEETPTVGLAFGVSGTPMAVLVDADGRVASTVAVGAAAVLALVDTAQPLPSGSR